MVDVIHYAESSPSVRFRFRMKARIKHADVYLGKENHFPRATDITSSSFSAVRVHWPARNLALYPHPYQAATRNREPQCLAQNQGGALPTIKVPLRESWSMYQAS